MLWSRLRHCLEKLRAAMAGTSRVASTHQSVGAWGEDAAVNHLRRTGCKILHRGYRTRYSELDIVAVDGKVLVIVEVKSRRAGEAADAMRAVDAKKQERLARAALAYRKRFGLLETPCRFDVIAVTRDESGAPNVVHVSHAFQSPLRGQFFG